MAKSSFHYRAADDSPGFLLFRLNYLWLKELNAIFANLGITQTQYAILASVLWFEEQGEPISQSDLVSHTKIEKMTLSKAIRNLETKGFVSRTHSGDDSRAMSITFSKSGKRLTKNLIRSVEKADEAFFSVLTVHDLKAYKSVTLKMIRLNIRE